MSDRIDWLKGTSESDLYAGQIVAGAVLDQYRDHLVSEIPPHDIADLSSQFKSQFCEWVKSDHNISNPECAYTEFMAFLNKSGPIELTLLIGGVRDDDLERLSAKANSNFTPIVSQVLHLMLKSVPPLSFKYVIGKHWITRSIEQFGEQMLCCTPKVDILVDTNVLISLLCVSEPKHHVLKRVLDRLVGSQGITLFVLDRTVTEFDRFVQSSHSELMAFLMRAMDRSPSDDEIAAFSPITFDFCRRGGGTSFAQWSDNNLEPFFADQIFHLLDLHDYLDDSERTTIEEKVKILHQDHPRLYRGWDIEYHDCALSYVAEKGYRSGIPCFVWTIHKALAGYSSKPCIAYGPAPLFACKDITREELRRIMESYLEPSDLSKADLASVAETVRQMTQSRAMEKTEVQSSSWFAREEDTNVSDLFSTMLAGQVPLSGPPQSADTVTATFSGVSLDSCQVAQWSSWTMPMFHSHGAHRAQRPVFVVTSTRPGVDVCNQWRMCVHSLTHVDLPWAINLEDPRVTRFKHKDLPSCNHEFFPRAFSRFVQPRLMDALVFDLSRIADSLAERIVTGDPALLRENVWQEPRALAEIMCELAIGMGDINYSSDMTGKTVIIYTGWAERYGTGSASLHDPVWELRAAWPTHPWVTQGAARRLVEGRPFAIGIDAPMLDSPLYTFLAEKGDDPRTKEMLAHFRTAWNERWGEKATEDHQMTALQPMHLQALSQGVLLLESLYITKPDVDALRTWARVEDNVYQTRCFMEFFPVELMDDAALCKVSVQTSTQHIKRRTGE